MDRTAGPDGGGPTEATPLTSSVPPSPAPMSDADADADRMGEELLGLSSEDDSYEWIRRSLNLLPVDESAAEAADPVEDVPSGMRKTRSASAGRGHHHGGGIGGSSQGLRRVITYGGGGAAATFSERTARWEELPSSQPAWRQQHRPGSPSGSVPSGKVACMVLIAFAATAGLAVGLLGVGRGRLVGPSRQPVGAYRLVELQEAEAFWDYYNFYVGPDSVGSNGFNSYIGRERALQLGIANVTREVIPSDERSAAVDPSGNGEETAGVGTAKERVVDEDKASVFADSSDFDFDSDSEPFIYMGSAPTADGPREAIRLEGRRRFNRGLFIIDLRHMPTGCGIWPAFWLTDEANWPLNGEIDIVEGINFQSVAKTALHSTKVCKMDDVPIGTKTGTWDNSTGIPNKKTGIPDPTPREATNCFVYDPHQWLNQGCVAVESRDGTLGKPLNDKGGGVFVLDWDPINRHIRTWVSRLPSIWFLVFSVLPSILCLAGITCQFWGRI